MEATLPVYNITISDNTDPAPPTLREVAAAQSNAHGAMARLCGFDRFHGLPEADQRAIWRQNAQIIRNARALRRIITRPEGGEAA